MPLKAYFSPAAFDLLDSVIIFMCVSVYGFVKKWRDYKSPRPNEKKTEIREEQPISVTQSSLLFLLFLLSKCEKLFFFRFETKARVDSSERERERAFLLIFFSPRRPKKQKKRKKFFGGGASLGKNLHSSSSLSSFCGGEDTTI